MTINEVSRFICQWILDKTNVAIDESEDIFLVGKIDSLLFAELITTIEDKFSVIVDFSALDNWELTKTPAGLSEIIRL